MKGENNMVGRIAPIGYGYNSYGMYAPSMTDFAMKGQRVNGASDSLSTDAVSSADSSDRVKKTECQTCKNRKYVDGSDEMVSFKTPTKMSPARAAAGVRAHEQEHVNNAYGKAAAKDGKVLQASVSLKMAVCPECGRTYIAGGSTTTKIAYDKENPYSRNQQSLEKEAATGNNIDLAV